MSWEEWLIVSGVGALLLMIFVGLEILLPAPTHMNVANTDDQHTQSRAKRAA